MRMPEDLCHRRPFPPVAVAVPPPAQPGGPEARVVRVHPLCTHLTLDIICIVVLGRDFHMQDQEAGPPRILTLYEVGGLP